MRLKPLKKLLRSVIGRRKADMARRRPKKPDPPKPIVIRSFIDSRRIANVIDVGANSGQFALWLRKQLGYQGRIISLEPLPGPFAELQARAAEDTQWSALNLALGDTDGIMPINIAGNVVSSSILPMLERHVRSAPSSAYVGSIDVPVRRLASLPELCAAARDRCLLKIDAQGYEQQILDGTGSLVEGLSLLYLEASLVPLYEGGVLIEELIAHLRRRGFAPVDIARGYRDGTTGQQLQADILFAKV